jgi:hypothetical protein
MPQSYTIPAELAEWKAWLDAQAAAGADPGPFMLKTAQHLGKGLVLLPGAAAYHAATQPRCACVRAECCAAAAEYACNLHVPAQLLR